MISFSLEELEIKDKFVWLDYDHPYLKGLRDRCNLGNLVNNEMNDITKVEVTMEWVNGLWEHNGENEPIQFDPLYILEQVSKGKQFRCVEYAVVLNGCLNALGLRSRILSLKMQDCETREYGAGHVVVEVFITELNKWIMADPQFNVVPYKNNEPLNAVELSLTIKELVDYKRSFNDGFSYYEWISPYLFYFTINLDNKINDKRSYKEREQIMLVPLGANLPRVFQRVHSIGKIEYTHSLNRFYATPI